ncbi:MAG TPA: hypothetical protein VM755_06665 [Stellaceae bacterium]|nr:hypothetical protein [Stellaceae bacterium]
MGDSAKPLFRPTFAIGKIMAGLRLFLAISFALALSIDRSNADGVLLGPSLSGAYPQTSLHYAANGNISSSGVYLPGADGFNLADVSSVGALKSLPRGVKGLVYLGLCGGATSHFIKTVKQFIGRLRLFGFYLMDEPDPSTCQAGNLKAEADWIHANAPGVETFIVLMNMSSATNPSYANTYNSANTDIDLFGLDPYPCQQQFGGCNYKVIPAAVAAAEASGIAASQIVPVYQAFGGGGYSAWLMPTGAEETQLLATWSSVVPAAVFDYAYSWGVQNSDQALSTSPDLQAVFLQKNEGL